MRKTKIVCTLGPSTDDENVLRQLMLEGMSVARMNFSHGSHEEQKKRLDMVKKLREELELPVAALLDTKGPEIRIGDIEGGKAELKKGQTFVLTTEDIVGNAEIVSITYKQLYKDVKPGDSILIDDGLIGMEVQKIEGEEIVCQVKNGGFISNHKGVNVPGVELKMPFVSQKDYEELLSETAFSNLMSFEVLLDTYGNVTGKALSGNPPEDAYQQKELHEVLRRGIASLRENERLVLSLYYEKELTMKEIAQVLGVSAPRISQIHNRAIQRLQAYMKQYIGA